MTLAVLLDRARTLLEAGNEEDAERLLASAMPAVDGECVTTVLLEFANLCHAWGPDELEEAALRRALHLGPSFDATRPLLDLLQQQLNGLDGQQRLGLAVECLRLGDIALSMLDAETGEDWANLILCRGLRRLDLARGGGIAQLAQAEADFLAYIAWLDTGVDVPEDWNRSVFIDDANIELAEVLLLTGREAESAPILENSIAAMEARGAPDWMTARPYDLLERAQ